MKIINYTKNYTRYAKFFNKLKPNLSDNDRGLIKFDYPYESNANIFYQTLNTYCCNDDISSYIQPIIKNRNDVYKLNGFVGWTNAQNINLLKKKPYLKFTNNIWLTNPNLNIFNNYIDSSLLNLNHEFRFDNINLKYISCIEPINNKIKLQNSDISIYRQTHWSFYANPQNYNIDNLVKISNVLNNNFIDLRMYNFKYPHPDPDNIIKLQRIYYVEWNTLCLKENIKKFTNYLSEWEKNSKPTDRLYINMPNISSSIINTLNIELTHRMQKLNYIYLIKVPRHMTTRYLDIKYWNNGPITDCVRF